MVYAKVMLAEISSSLRLPKALRSRCLDSGRSLDLSCALHKRDQCSSMLSSILPGKLYTMWGICTFHIWTFLSTRQPHGMRASRKVQAPVWLASHARLYSCLPCFQKKCKERGWVTSDENCQGSRYWALGQREFRRASRSSDLILVAIWEQASYPFRHQCYSIVLQYKEGKGCVCYAPSHSTYNFLHDA